MSNATTNGNKMSAAGSTGPHMLWLPSVLVATVMLSFLGMSFTRHIRRVKRKKQILLDYISFEIDVNRCRISANLCNTYSMPLRQLASSMRIHIVEDQDGQVKTVRRPYLQQQQQQQSAVPTGRIAHGTPRGAKDVSIELDSPDSEFPTDTDECVKIKVDLLCEKCREHILKRPMFYLSEDSQSAVDVVAGRCVNQGIIIEEATADGGKTVVDVRPPEPLPPLPRYVSSITSEEEECDRNWTPLICRVPTVIVTDMSDIELDLFQQETYSMESIDYDYTQSSVNRPNHRHRATVLLSTEEIIGHFDAVSNECTSKLSYDDFVLPRSRFSDNSSADSPDYKSPKGARDFFKFFSRRRRRKTTRTVRKPVLTKQDKIGPINEVSSRSLEDVNRHSFRGRTWNLGQRRKRFARTKPVEKTVSSDMDPNHSNENHDVYQCERSNQSWTKLQKSNSADSNRSELSKPHSFESQVTFLEDNSIRQKCAIQDQGKTRSCDGVMQEVEGSDTLERVTLTPDGGCHRTKSVDSNLGESFRILTYLGERLGSGSRSDG